MYNIEFLVLLGKEKQETLLKESQARRLLDLLRSKAQPVTPRPRTAQAQEEQPCPA
jgi:hypothetical protein